jgi:predicted 2-oxoglutarate/Fe(II)-dependent dioxygenase YbiX
MVIFSKEDCEYIKSFYSYYKEIDGMDTHNFNDLEIRFRKGSSAKFVIIDNIELKNFLLEKLKPLKVKNIPTIKIMKYTKGGRLAKHQDFSRYGVDIIYKTLLVQLSDSVDYIGGDLIVENTPQSRVIGSITSISPTVEHEVTMLENGERYSLVLFLYESDFDIQKTML